MARPPETMPEGTDAIIPGASAEDDNEFTIDGGRPVEGEAGDGFALAHGQDFNPIPVDELKSSSGGTPSEGLKETAQRIVGEKTAGLREQATDKARAFATQGKDKATEALDNIVRLIEEAAGTVDENVGEQYGDYIRRASEAVAGISADLRDKDVDDLVEDARDVVRRSPALAIGAAAAVGFLIARIAKVGLAPAETAANPGPAGKDREPA